MISLRTHKPEMPGHFCHLIYQLEVVCKSIGGLYEQMFFPPTRLFGTSRLFIFTFLMTPPLFLFSTFEFSGQFTFFGIKIIDEK